MKSYIPTYEECIEIVNSNPDMYFYEKKYLINGYYLSVFGYRYAKYNNFILPIINKPHINAIELKGISFVFDDNGNYKHYLLLHKFWELDQYEHCTYEKYINKPIKNISVKEDGFLVSFLYLPNKEIVSFTKHGFDEPTNIYANQFLDDNNYYNFIKTCLDNNIQPIFEHVKNEMIVNYGDVNNLVLIKLRNNLTGEYLDIDKFDTTNIKIVKNEFKTLDELLTISNEIENCEGWVVQFNDDDMLKIKTKWWRNQKNGSMD